MLADGTMSGTATQPGDYTVVVWVVLADGSRAQAELRFSVSARPPAEITPVPAGTPTPTGTPIRSIPVTGTDTSPMTRAATTLMLVGLGLMAARTRRFGVRRRG